MTSKKLNIAMFGHKRVPSREGGVEIVVGELARRMAAERHLVTIFNRSEQYVQKEVHNNETNEYENIDIREVFTVNKKGLAEMTSSVFASIGAVFGNYDVVHIHAEGPAFMCWLPKLMGKKVIVTIHGSGLGQS